jgi:hypothetical protein
MMSWPNQFQMGLSVDGNKAGDGTGRDGDEEGIVKCGSVPAIGRPRQCQQGGAKQADERKRGDEDARMEEAGGGTRAR